MVEDVDVIYEKLCVVDVCIYCLVISFNGGLMKVVYCCDLDGNVFEIMMFGWV